MLGSGFHVTHSPAASFCLRDRSGVVDALKRLEGVRLGQAVLCRYRQPVAASQHENIAVVPLM
jgi:hypothetical protein